MINRDLQLIGIARKAGLLAVGLDASLATARLGRASAVLVTNDASTGASKRARISAEECGAVFAVLPYTKSELGNITGRGSPGTIALLDAGLAAEILKSISKAMPERYEKDIEYLKDKAHPGGNRNDNTAVNWRTTK